MVDPWFAEQSAIVCLDWPRLCRCCRIRNSGALLQRHPGLHQQLSLRSPAQNLVQAMRDCFGSHTYQRVDKEGTFHTEWLV